MGYAPEQCIVVEDSPAGIAAANAAGMLSIGYAGQTPVDLLRDSRITIDRMDMLVETITRPSL
jgi:sugar-phosphatase